LRRTATALERSNDELRASVVQRKHAEDEARAGVELRDRFLAMLSHELRNPLAAILNAARLMNCESLDAEANRLAQGVIQRQSHHMARLLDDLLDVSRITRNKIDIRKQVVDLRASAHDAVESVNPQVTSRDHRLHVELPATPLYVEGDPARLQQIQVNLLNNAIKYTPRGGDIWLSQERDGDQAVLRVRDTGIGIPPHMRERIFDLFVQLDGASGLDGGMGVGLTLVRTLMYLHNGTITAHSDGPNRGTEFVARFPLAPLLPATSSPDPLDAALAGLSFLVVDDNGDIRETTLRLLQAIGCEASEAGSGQQAIEAIRINAPDVALVDIGMPGMNGYETARHLRQMHECDGVLLIALTGYGQEGDRLKALDAGFHAHLVKPIDLDQLARVVRQFRSGNR
jgi:two-component system CheB/CheR fusion protein